MKTITEIGGPTSWLGPDHQRSDEWILELEETHRQELLGALGAAEVAGLDFLEMTRESFPLPTTGPLLVSMLDDLLEGRGFVLLRGVPIEGLSERQIELLYWGWVCTSASASRRGVEGHRTVRSRARRGRRPHLHLRRRPAQPAFRSAPVPHRHQRHRGSVVHPPGNARRHQHHRQRRGRARRDCPPPPRPRRGHVRAVVVRPQARRRPRQLRSVPHLRRERRRAGSSPSTVPICTSTRSAASTCRTCPTSSGRPWR